VNIDVDPLPNGAPTPDIAAYCLPIGGVA